MENKPSFEKLSSNEIAQMLHIYLIKNKERFVSYNMFAEDNAKHFTKFLKNYDEYYQNRLSQGMKVSCFLQKSPAEKIREEHKDILKKAKKKLHDGLRAYGLDFETQTQGGREDYFRYPQDLNFNPLEVQTKRELLNTVPCEYNNYASFDKREADTMVIDFEQIKGRIQQGVDKHQVIEFDYIPSFDSDKPFIHVILSPHHIHEYNGRKYVFGYAIMSDYGSSETYIKETGNFTLDRIFSNITFSKNREFIKPSVNYDTFFDDIVGVTHFVPYGETSTYPIETVRIKTLTLYAHGRLLTRPIHKSQKEERPFADGYGIVTVSLRYNKEFLGVIMNFQSSIEILSPQYIRKAVSDEVRKMNELYN